MYDVLHFFKDSSGKSLAVCLPFDLDKIVGDWARLSGIMARMRHDAFSRDEWAYLITFLDSRFLKGIYTGTLGTPTGDNPGNVSHILRPRGKVAVWLPNNVSLLGPLVLILVSLTGNPVIIKGGSRSQNLVGLFLEYACAALGDCTLKDYLVSLAKVVTFSHDDPQLKEMAAQAQVRLVFGSRAAAGSIDALPHPPGSLGFSFSDRQSEVWLESEAVTDDILAVLIKVLAVYGRAGCTSPQKVVVIGGGYRDAVDLAERLAAMWRLFVRRDVEQHVASENVKCFQWAAALGWRPVPAERNGAVFAAGGLDLPVFTGGMTLPVVFGTADQALAALPGNIQTIGHALCRPCDNRWISVLGNSRIKRFVPIAKMHHFGPFWDGYSYWSSLFEDVEIRS